MTTVVYNHEEKEIGIDSRVTSGNFIESDDYIKMIEANGIKFFLCGEVAGMEMIVRNYPDDLEFETNSHGFLLKDGVITYLYTDGLKIREITQNNSLSVGSGSEWALAALDMGKTTEEAIKYAMTRDNSTGGKIRIYKLTEEE